MNKDDTKSHWEDTYTEKLPQMEESNDLLILFSNINNIPYSQCIGRVILISEGVSRDRGKRYSLKSLLQHF